MCYPISTKPYSTLNKIIKKSTVSTVYKSLFQLLLRPQLFSFSTLCWLFQFNNKLIRKAWTGKLGNCFRQTSKSLDIDIDVYVRFTDKELKVISSMDSSIFHVVILTVCGYSPIASKSIISST